MTGTGTMPVSKSGSGSDKNGFVVYRQTVDLVSMLEENETDEEEEGGEGNKGGNEDEEEIDGEKENNSNTIVDNEKCNENRSDNDHD